MTHPSTFLDANVLISAVSGREPHRSRALRYFFKRNYLRGSEPIFEIGSREALRHGIPVVDAMHLAGAPLTKSVLVTNERPGKPLYRSRIAEVAYLPALTE